MGLTKLGKYIVPLDSRNTDNLYNEDAVVGLSTQKMMISTKADLTGVNLTSYKLMPPGSFAYVPDTSRRGNKMSLAFNSTNNTYLVSSISIVFIVNKPDELISDYLFMYFNRPEFDRYSRFNSWGSARETFSWDDMCDIDIELPPVPIQQKYVDVYNSMVANQQCYERGLEDLKLAFEALIDKNKHSSPKHTVGTMLTEIDNRNDDGKIVDVQGINITKQFMPSVANTANVNLNKYKIVQAGQFAYSGMQTGRDECIRIALYDGNAPIIISPAYSVLQVNNDSVLPEYIMMWFSRKESDRRGWFMSDASIRANLDLDRFYETEIPVPSLAVQKAIVDIYCAYTTRREINERLKALINDICPILIKGSIEEASA
jgi:type I restriction enzyme S subunit